MPRLFVSIAPSPETAEQLLGLLNPAATDLRVVPSEQIHLTLQFIGDIGVREMPGAMESVRRAAAGVRAFVLTIESLATFPLGETAPRLIAAIADSPPELLEIQSRLARRFARKARPKTHDRFIPHLTLGRFKPGAKAAAFRREVEPIRQPIGAICLMESILHPSGAEHRVLERVNLG
jgi:2'-5' RNA ligase